MNVILSYISEDEKVLNTEFFTNWIAKLSVTTAEYAEQNWHITELRDTPELWRELKYLFLKKRYYVKH